MRLTHPFEQEEVMAYLDGEIPSDRAAEIALHMQKCVECQALAASFHTLSQQFAAWEIEASPAIVTESVLNASERKVMQEKEDPAKVEPELQWKWRQVLTSPHIWAFACVFVAVLIVGKATLTPRSSSHVVRLTQDEAARLNAHVANRAGGGGGVGVVGGAVGQSQQNASRALQQKLDEERLSSSLQNNVPSNGRDYTSVARLEPGVAPSPVSPPSSASSPSSSPMIARTASLSIVAKDFASVESAVKGVTARHSGYIGELNTAAPPDAAKSFSATLRIPSAQLDAALAELKQLGHVEQETQGGEEVTKQYTDLAARLKNSRATEQRLLDVLRNNTGKVKDVLEVENEISRVRGEIEEMEADQRALQSRVDFATITLSVAEEYKASLHSAPFSTSARLHNAFVAGYHSVVENVIGLLAWLLESGPTLLLWAALLFFPVRWIWKRARRALTTKPAAA